MRPKLTSPSAVLRPLKPLGDFFSRLLRGVSRRPPKAPPRTRPTATDSDQRLSFMLESVPVNLWSTDAQLNITFSQGAGLHLIGASATEQVGMTLYEVLKTRDPGFTPLAAHLRALQGELAAGLSREADDFGRLFGTEDQKEGMRAFVEKREPRFTGR